MDKEQAIHSFWSGFGLTAYDETTVPVNVQMPYIAYNVSTGALGDIIQLHASLWYHSTSWKDITEKAEEIAESIGKYGHKIINYDNGKLYLTQGVPFAQRMSDPADSMIRRIYINVSAEFLSAF